MFFFSGKTMTAFQSDFESSFFYISGKIKMTYKIIFGFM